jgi:hypothetical protein
MQKVSETPSQWEKAGHVVHTCHPGYHQKCETEGSWSMLAWSKIETLFQNSQSKKGWRCG